MRCSLRRIGTNLPQHRTLPQRSEAPAGQQQWPVYADGVTPLPILPDGSPDWNAYYTGYPTAQQAPAYPAGVSWGRHGWEQAPTSGLLSGRSDRTGRIPRTARRRSRRPRRYRRSSADVGGPCGRTGCAGTAQPEPARHAGAAAGASAARAAIDGASCARSLPAASAGTAAMTVDLPHRGAAPGARRRHRP